MPRKQRFKPSRKLEADGTLTDLAPLDRGGPATPTAEPARSREVGFREVEPGRRDTDVFSSMIDLGGESG